MLIKTFKKGEKMMRHTTKKVLSWVLAVLTVLSCLTVVPMAVSAETAPTVDGVKDDIYVDTKMIEVNTAYGADGGGATKENTDGVTMKVYYNWDDTYVYVFADIVDPSATQGSDVFYFTNTQNYDSGFFALCSCGGYITLNPDGSGTPGGAVALNEWKGTRASDSNNRTYEFKFAKAANAQGFIFSMAAINGAYAVAYGAAFGQSVPAKLVMFEDQSTWYEQKLVKEEIEDPLLDGQKDDRYSDAKKMTVTRAYAGGEQAETENSSGMSIDLWYAWDDDYNYIYAEFKDPNGAGEQDGTYGLDYLYFTNNTNELVQTWVWNQTGGGYMEHKNVSDVLGGQNCTAKFVKGDGVRQYEIRFARDAAADGFRIGATAMTASNFIVASDAFNSTKGASAVKYEDESTWIQNFAPTSGGEGGGDDTPPPPTPPAPTPSADGIDAIKDDRYDEERVTTISIARAGSGGSSITNKHHIYIKMYYAWDETNNYVYWEVYDPFNTPGLDVLYYITNTNHASGWMFQVAGGGYLQFDSSTAGFSTAADVDGRTIQYASFKGDGINQYEAVLPKSEGAIGMQLSPVAYREDGKYSVSYDTNYYMLPNKNINYENAAGHWTDNSVSDPNCMTDPAKLEAANAEMAKLPADASTLTYEDKELVDGVKATMAAIPESWYIFMDEAMVARYKAAVAKMNELEAVAREEEITAIEDAIKALPESVTLEDLEILEEIMADIVNLGELDSFLDEALYASFTEKYNYAISFTAPVKVDGKKDPIYDKDDKWPITTGFRPWTSSDVHTIDPPSVGTIWTAADDNYSYVYIEIVDANGFVECPADQEFSTSYTSIYDCITSYFDLDPSYISSAHPYLDAGKMDDNMFYFSMLSDGRTLIDEKASKYITAGSLASFKNGNTYGYELRLPRIEGEESFKVNVVFSDPTWVEGEYVEDQSYNIAIGPEWAYNYTNYGEKFYEDYVTFYTYVEVIEMINALPAAEEISDDSYDKKITRAVNAMELLNEVHMAFISEELVAKLAALEAIVGVYGPAKPEFTYGDLNNDGEENAVDALMILQIAVDKLEATDVQKQAADVSGDGNINAEDALYVLQKAVNKITEYPAQKQ